MRHWQQAGIAEVHTGFSAAPDHPYRFVQDAITADSDGIWHAIQDGTHIYVCGDGKRMAPAGPRDTRHHLPPAHPRQRR